MFSGRLCLSLALTCGFGLFSVGCLSKKNEEVSAEAAPPPSAYPSDPVGYGDTTGAPAPGGPAGTSVRAATPPQPAPFELRDNEELVIHLIVSGESLSSISGKYNSSISRIMAANGMADTKIYAGKSLQVPIVKSSQVAMNGAPRPSTSAPAYGSPAPAPGLSNPSVPAPPTNYGAPSSAPVYPGTTVDPSSTSYPRQTIPTAPAGSFPTPSF